MSPELDRALCERYPKIFVDRHAPETQRPICRGFEVGDGWYHLIDTLCEQLQFETDHNNASQVVATQVKEKLGGLRFYGRPVTERQRGMILMAEAMAERLCAACGAHADPVTERWKSPACALHQ